MMPLGKLLLMLERMGQCFLLLMMIMLLLIKFVYCLILVDLMVVHNIIGKKLGAGIHTLVRVLCIAAIPSFIIIRPASL